MADILTQGIEQNDPDKRGIEYVDQLMPDGSTERRYLATTPTNAGHKMLALPGMKASGIKPVAKADWPSLAFERIHSEVPILDQGQRGACTAHAGATACMLARVSAGAAHIPLSPWYIYSNINHGVDQGSGAGDMINSLTTDGVCEASLVHGDPITPPGINPAARNNGQQYRLHSSMPLTVRAGDQTISECLTAIALGYSLLLDVEAGSNFNTAANGTIGFCGYRNNHEVCAQEGIRFDARGNPEVLMRNSWARWWGQNGGGWLTVQHLLASQVLFAVRAMLVNKGDVADLAVMP